jgi:hypothetical protein
MEPAAVINVREGAAGDLGDFVVVFRPNETRLAACELAELRRWVGSWLSAERPCLLIIGCCADSGREGRLHRLHDLREQVVACGIPRESVRYTDEWIEPAWRRGASELPQDVVWLKAVGSTEVGHGVGSMRDVFTTSDSREMERQCTREY